MDELTLFEKFRDMCIGHTSSDEWMEIHGFGVGYLWHINLDNFDQSSFRKDHFYSEGWFRSGKDPERMTLDFPFCLMLPPGGEGIVTTKGWTEKDVDMKVTFIMFDLLYKDRQNSNSTVYAKRSREDVWRDTAVLGKQLLIEMNKFTPGGSSNFKIMGGGSYTQEKVFEWQSERLAGTQFEIKVRITDDCDVGSFDYSRTLPNEISKPGS